jgi:hypothetical protein
MQRKPSRKEETTMRRIITISATLLLAAAGLMPLNQPAPVEAQQADPAAVRTMVPGSYVSNDPSSVEYRGNAATPTPTATQMAAGRTSANVSTQGGGCFVFDGVQTDPITGGCRLNDPGHNHTGQVPDPYYAYQGTNNCTPTGQTVSGGVISFYFNSDPQTQQRCGTTFGWTPTPTITPTATPTTPASEPKDGACPLFGWAATHPNPSDGGCKLDKSVTVTGTVEPGMFALSGSPVHRYEAGQTFSASKASFYFLTPPTPSVTTTPTAQLCSPRPPISIQLTPNGMDLTVTITATSNAKTPGNKLWWVNLTDSRGKQGVQNALVDTVNLPSNFQKTSLGTGAHINVPDPTQVLVLHVRATGTGRPFVPLTVRDDCGDWSTFVAPAA